MDLRGGSKTSRNKKGFFVCIEGLDKCGKTTQSRLLVQNLRKLGYEAVYTSEPTKGEIGRLIRRYVLRRRVRAPPIMEAVLFAADRFEHVEKKIKPLLKEGKVVVSDRYLYSSLAYQGAAGLSMRWLMDINRFAPIPDLAIYIDVPLGILKGRMRVKSSVMERIQIQAKVKRIYEKLVRDGLLTPIDGGRPIREVSGEILRLVLERL